jgi:2,4-dienoyl-CoA reductase (NADPH2)
MVIGGGPGGLFAAKTAAIGGHRVTLYEQSDRMGGQLNLAGATDERSEYPPLIEVLTRQAEIAGVEIRKKTKVDEQLIKREGPETVILATGGEPIRPNIIGMDSKNAVLAWDVLGDKVDVGKEVVVIGGGATGVEVATYIAKIGTINADTLHFLFLNKAEEIDFLRELATRGSKKVTLVEMLDRIGMDIGLSTRWLKLQNLSNLGVNTLTKTTVKEITPEGVIVNQNGKTDMIRCDTVVIAVGTHPVNDLEEKIRDVVEKVIVIGDAKKPRKAYEAIKEGFFAGRES